MDYFTPEIDDLVRRLAKNESLRDEIRRLLERYDRISNRFDEQALLAALREFDDEPAP